MSRTRTWTRRLVMALTAAAPTAVVVVYAAAAEAVPCHSACASDRRLKRNVRPI